MTIRFANVIAVFTLVIGLLSLSSGEAKAVLLNYEFVVTQSLRNFDEAIGGTATPITLNFLIDAHAQSLNPPIGAQYQFGYGTPGYASVSVGGTVSTLAGGGIDVNSGPLGVGFNANANGYDTGVRIFGRSLFSAYVGLYDPSGRTFDGIDLPLNVQSPFSVYFGLQFRPGPLDANQNEYLKFDAFVHPDNYTSSVTVVAVPLHATTWPMTIVALTGLLFLSHRLKRRRSLDSGGTLTAVIRG